MSKAIFVLDEMPDNCYDCPLRVYLDGIVEYVCQDITNWDFEETDNEVFEVFCKCPLKEMPQKREKPKDSSYDFGFAKEIDGWNACIDEMLKENDDGTETD